MPLAASWTLRAISCVAAPCSSTAAAIVVAISFTELMVAAISWMAPTDSFVAFWIAVICWPISSVAFAVWVARLLTSAATTAKPLPASPARAASIVALSASRLVWLAMSLISLTTSPIFCAACARPCTVVSVRLACGDGLAGDPRGLRDLAADLRDRGGQLLGRAGDRLHVRRGLLRSRGDRGGLARRLLGIGGQRVRGALHPAGSRGDRVEHQLHLTVEIRDRGGDLVLALLPLGQHRLLIDRDRDIHVEHDRRIHGRQQRSQSTALPAVRAHRQFVQVTEHVIVAADVPARLQADLVVDEADGAHPLHIGVVEAPAEETSPVRALRRLEARDVVAEQACQIGLRRHVAIKPFEDRRQGRLDDLPEFPQENAGFVADPHEAQARFAIAGGIGGQSAGHGLCSPFRDLRT